MAGTVSIVLGTLRDRTAKTVFLTIGSDPANTIARLVIATRLGRNMANATLPPDNASVSRGSGERGATNAWLDFTIIRQLVAS